MAGVDDIPGVALAEGIAWNWRTFPEDLDALDGVPHDVDFAAQIPHAALRVWAMGEHAAAHEQSIPVETALMTTLAREAIDAGALGFTTSRTLHHKSVNGELTPSYDTGVDELIAIGKTGAGVLQLVTDWEDDPSSEFALIRKMLEVSGRQMPIAVARTTSLRTGCPRFCNFWRT